MYAPLVLAAVLLGILAASAPVAVERTTGRMVVARGGAVEVWGADLIRVVATLPAPPGEVDVLQFAGGVVTYAFTLPEDGSPARAAVGVEDGVERLIWPNSGVGERFPGLAARLTADGQGVFEFLALDSRLRSELGVGEDIPDGAGTVVTYRFADERVWAIAAADFAGALALSAGDALVVTADGGVLRYRSSAGPAWRRPGDGSRREILDVDLAQGVVLLGSEHGLELVTADLGERRGAWAQPGLVDARVLSNGRLLAATKAGDVLMVSLPEQGAGSAESFPHLAGEGWQAGTAPCCGGSGPLACLHPVPGGVVAPTAAGWRLVPLAGPASGGGGGPPGRPTGGAPAHIW